MVSLDTEDTKIETANRWDDYERCIQCIRIIRPSKPSIQIRLLMTN